MTDSYLVSMEDPKTFKVGEMGSFTGSAGLKVDSIELVVDGFSIGEVGFGRPADGADYKLWRLDYIFKNAAIGRSLMLIAKGDGFKLNRTQLINVEPKEVVKPETGGKFPVTIVESKVRHVTRGDMQLEGLCVHFTAGRQINDPTSTINMANDPDHSAYAFWVMNSEGIVSKTHNLDKWGYHCGTYHHRTYLGIEIMSPGLLTERNGKLYPWFDFKNDVPRERARYFEGGKQQIKGWYWPYTKAQEDALIGLIQFLKDTEPKFKLENVKGHDEICYEAGYPGAKNDPGGSLSMSMPAFREYLKTVIV